MKEAHIIRRDLERAERTQAQSWQDSNAISLWRDLSDEGKVQLCVLLATYRQSLAQRVTGLGAVSLLVLTVALVRSGEIA